MDTKSNRMDRLKLSNDFAGEFSRIRKSGLEAREDRLISGARSVSLLRKIPMIDTDTYENWKPAGAAESRSPLSSDASPKRAASSLANVDRKFKMPKLIKFSDQSDPKKTEYGPEKPLALHAEKIAPQIRLDGSKQSREMTGTGHTPAKKTTPKKSIPLIRFEGGLPSMKITPKKTIPLIRFDGSTPSTPRRSIPLIKFVEDIPTGNNTPRKTIPLIKFGDDTPSGKSSSKKTIPLIRFDDISAKKKIPIIKFHQATETPQNATPEMSQPTASLESALSGYTIPFDTVIDLDDDDDDEKDEGNDDIPFFDLDSDDEDDDDTPIEYDLGAEFFDAQDTVPEGVAIDGEGTQPNESNDSDESGDKMEEKAQQNENKDSNNNKDNETERRPDRLPKVRTEDTELSILKRKILSKLHGKSSHGPYEIEEPVDELYQLIQATVKTGEKHACCIFGARNTGKTAAFDSVIRRLRSETKSSEDDFILVRINGLAQCTDQEAVRAIANQMDSEISRIYDVNIRELEVNELLSRKSITYTFANILQVLDKEIVLDEKNSSKIKHPVIFCIDEVDIYANQNRQTLLYNLFDLVEHSQTPVCVVCFTCKVTMKELLEKRVASRFSHRSIHFRKLARDKFLNVAKQLLSVDEPINSLEEEWNEHVETLVESNSKVRRILIRNHMTVNDIKEFANSCVLPVSSMRLVDSEFGKFFDNQWKSSLAGVVETLTDLELFLIVSATRVAAKSGSAHVNLNIVHEEYSEQAKFRGRELVSSTGRGAVASSNFKIWSKNACKLAWESLQSCGMLVVPLQGRSEAVNASFLTRMWEVEPTLDELRLLVSPERAAKPWTRL